ncbi:Aste57867_2933 [Aphanomyces stellatus]|uniref:Aste57867_2933 protein n=1 Tax=Aphanomyces stellatus TaxID=120398 RepID=A0A485K9P4_9STRA|nr:hypothetical protein As57867_002925 [Aphanomyces stellatus]VFT80116.1 Aste57867_2933 [Aphanomyces stellatus]
MAERWHIIPHGMAKYVVNVSEIVDFMNDPTRAFYLCKGFKCGREGPDKFTFCSRIRLLYDIVDGYPGTDARNMLTAVLNDVFIHIEFTIQDGAGAMYHLDMMLNDGNADAITGFYASEWDVDTSD